MFKKLFIRFSYPVKGVVYAVNHDASFRGQFYIGGIILTLILTVFFPLTLIEVLFAVLAWVLVLITELQNSAFEAALDHLHPELHQEIGKSKDMAAGAVLLAGLFALFVLLTILLHQLFPILF
jgi:undecaprenol kinase